MIINKATFTFALFGLLSIGSITAPLSAAELDKQALRKAISGPDREVTDYVRDAVRKPVEVLGFLGLEPGMRVLDLYAAGGYYTFILSKAVGSDGVVFAQNTPRGLRYEEDRQDITQGEALEAKIRDGNLTNVSQLVRRLADIGLAKDSLDLIIATQILHDYYNPNPERALEMLQRLKALLKPGGILGITDHLGLAGLDNDDMHRMEKQQAIDIAKRAGFIIAGDSDLLASDSDDHSRSIFDPRLNRNTDRFLLKLQKPF
ncbi:MAG: hypothetical protein COC19_08500 [SAR86 cluster bacterium]|uniref:Methyltransferase domain-containing protein n=1 Tax=SAR86 cluster bacterium TaxID=2030880 RepID=A0A2A4MEU4_9GAMM|nr:MAG: hypothetical protein COC19_08500 [SAR86 cluster bacterium]